MGRGHDRRIRQPANVDGYLRCEPRCLTKRRKPDVSFRNVGLWFCIHDMRFQT
jgi:hypothetical protein